MTVDISQEAAYALAHYYDGVDCEEAAALFFSWCVSALTEVTRQRRTRRASAKVASSAHPATSLR